MEGLRVLAAIGAGLLTALLAARDPLMAGRPGDRVTAALCWLVPVVGALLFFGSDPFSAVVVTSVLVAACAVTLGRPALLLDRLLRLSDRDDVDQRTKRKAERSGALFLLVLLVGVVAIIAVMD